MAEPAHVSHVTQEIVDNPDWRAAAWRANAWVRDVLGQWAGSKFIQWRLAPEGIGREFELWITEDGGSVTCHFSRSDLNNERTVRRAVLEAWGRLVDQSIHSGVEALKRFGEELRREAALARQN